MLINNFIIIGLTGVGKTTIAKLLAESLNKTFIDLDKSIENNCGVDIATIFSFEGEEGFRKRETKELKLTIEEQKDYVLSLGGGCVTIKENRNLILSKPNFVIQLVADINVIATRLSKSLYKRPLLSLNSQDLTSTLQKLYESRKPYYDEMSNLIINTSSLKPQEVIAHIIKLLKI